MALNAIVNYITIKMTEFPSLIMIKNFVWTQDINLT
jgi:hypothetical protein